MQHPKSKQTRDESMPDVLAGQFFHSTKETGAVEWQGYVIGSPQPGWYLVQLFEWLCGEPNLRRLVRFESMEHWLFYESAETMRFSYDYGTAREGGPHRPQTTLWDKKRPKMTHNGKYTSPK